MVKLAGVCVGGGGETQRELKSLGWSKRVEEQDYIELWSTEENVKFDATLNMEQAEMLENWSNVADRCWPDLA